jgi:NADH-quinone oxidoreductase subunit I
LGISDAGVELPGRVKRVRRNERLGWAERLYLPTIFVGLNVTARVFFRNFWGYMRGKPSTFVVQYPEQRLDYADAFRGHPVLVQLDSGKPKCVACGLCEFACPTDCITILPAETSDRIERIPAVFDIDMSRCMFCGLCEEACPEEAIVMSRDVELASTEREPMLYHMKDLLRTEEQVQRRLDLIRQDYARP